MGARMQDFYNLVDVYLDAVLYPNCVRDEQTFQQEGWHYELDKPDEDITFKGVPHGFRGCLAESAIAKWSKERNSSGLPFLAVLLRSVSNWNPVDSAA